MSVEAIKLYFAETNVEVSPKGDLTNPVEFALRFDQNADEEVRLYAEAETGYKVTETEVEPISANGEATTDMWALAPDTEGSAGTYEAWGASLTLGTVEAGAGGRVYFWAKAKSASTEYPHKDETVVLEAKGVVEEI